MSKERKKKSIFKRWWFWIVIIVIVIIAIATGSGGNDDAPKKVSGGEKVNNPKKDDTLSKTYKVGDTVSYKGYEIKVNNVKYSKGSEYEEPDSGKQYVIINVTIKNNTDEKQSYNPFDFKLNDNGNSTDLYETISEVKDTLNSGDLDKGASVSGNLVGQAKKDTKNLKLQYQTSIWNDKTVDIKLK